MERERHAIQRADNSLLVRFSIKKGVHGLFGCATNEKDTAFLSIFSFFFFCRKKLMQIDLTLIYVSYSMLHYIDSGCY